MKILTLALAMLIAVSLVGFAEDFDLTNYSDTELDALEHAIAMEREARANYMMEEEEAEEESAMETEPLKTALIQKGQNGEKIREVQGMLKQLGYLRGSADGIFGQQTEKAIQAYQTDNGMEPDGIVTEELYNALGAKVQKAEAAKNALAVIGENLFTNATCSDGASENDLGGYSFQTGLEGNQFSYAAFQIYDSGMQYLMTVESTEQNGVYQADYTHGYESGEYFLVFKGNTNLQDEYAVVGVSLENGAVYHIAYTIESLESQRLVTSNVGFGIPMPENMDE